MMELVLSGGFAVSRRESRFHASRRPHTRGSHLRGLAGLLCAVIFAVVAVAYAAAPLTSPRAQDQAISQYDLEAVYLYNFAKFVRWPAADSTQSLDICVAGGQPAFLTSLRRIVDGENVAGRPIRMRLLDRSEQVTGCEILYLDASARDSSSLIEAALGKPILTVSDAPTFLDHGGMIQFIAIQHRVRFSVNLRPVTRCGLALSSELLKVAVSVKGQPSGGGAR